MATADSSTEIARLTFAESPGEGHINGKAPALLPVDDAFSLRPAAGGRLPGPASPQMSSNGGGADGHSATGAGGDANASELPPRLAVYTSAGEEY